LKISQTKKRSSLKPNPKGDRITFGVPTKLLPITIGIEKQKSHKTKKQALFRD
jgi:hypothetical protein